MEESAPRLPEGLSKRATKKIIPFCSVVLNVPFCPVKQKLRRNECEVSMVKIPQHKVTKWDNFFRSSFPRVFVQSDLEIFTAAVFPNSLTEISYFTSAAKVSFQREKISYICGLRTRIECEHGANIQPASDRVTNIGYLLSLEASVLSLPAAN